MAAYRTNRRRLLQGASAGMLAMAAGGGFAASAAAMRSRQQEEAEVTVFPRHGTVTASPYTEITFRGLTEETLGPVDVIGSMTGGHSGLFMPHSDGNGVSYVPDSRFEPGEDVTVSAEVALGSEDNGSITFTVAVPGIMAASPTEKVTDDPEVEPWEFQSRPDLRPPVMEVAVPAEDVEDGYIFLGTRVVDGQYGATILDNDGDYIWFQPPANDLDEHHEVRVQEYNSEPVVTFAEGIGPTGYRHAHFVICDTSYQRIAEFQIGNGITGGDHHELLLTPRGTAWVGCYYPVRWDLSPAGGSENGTALDFVIQEIDIEAGRVLFEWHSLDHVAVEESYSDPPSDEEGRYDYIHANSIDEDENGDLLISARHTYSIIKIDRATGDVAWRLNGMQSDFEMGEGAEFAYQHDARFHPDGQVSLFDNATSGSGNGVVSRGLVLDLDEEAMTATVAREHIHPEEVVSASQANMQLLPNGNALVGWGSAPVISEFDENGELVFDLHYPEGGNSYRAYRFPWTGQPSAPPDVAVERGDRGELTVYSSWNGATEVAQWRVLGGASPDELESLDTQDRTGFETGIEVETDTAYIVVEALDADETVLGASDPVEVDG